MMVLDMRVCLQYKAAVGVGTAGEYYRERETDSSTLLDVQSSFSPQTGMRRPAHCGPRDTLCASAGFCRLILEIASRVVHGTEPITSILVAYRHGQPEAFDRLVSLVYPELRRIARRQLRPWRPGLSLDTGAVVHDAYVKLVDQTKVEWQDRNHFFAIAARVMRQVIIDYARKRHAQKRGGSVSLGDREVAIQAQAEELLELNELLGRLEAEDPRLLQVVECRFFAGYSETETAKALGVSTRTVERDWLRARVWLKRALTESTPADGTPGHAATRPRQAGLGRE
jgi:RNA polymerase sigma-70 factor, ECF subfamily